jgi:hypothetical protein
MNQSLVSHAEPPEVPDYLLKQLRIRQLRMDAGQPTDLEYHPDAAVTAERLRASIQPTTFAIVRKWANALAEVGLVPKGVAMEARCAGIAAACARFPASVWNAQTVQLALQNFDWFPMPAQVYRLLKPEADKVLAVIEGLEAIAKAPPGERAVPAREPYKMQPVPDWVSAKRGRGDHTRPALNIQPPPRSVDEQIALLRGAR